MTIFAHSWLIFAPSATTGEGHHFKTFYFIIAMKALFKITPP
jgi:hypothetical protein